jgi:crotonobetainyl-CoA:carnitine CoA-transferase CaiB-like acyl-CoA transferase
MLPLLTGIRVLDLTAIILGPIATQCLGDFGADVIKIEPPEGDSMRGVPPVREGGVSAIFAGHNRNKRSLALDLKSEAGKAAFRQLIPTADVIVHNMRQDALDRLGFSYDVVRGLNPRLIYCAAVGYGSGGPYAGRPAYDDVIQAASGFAGLAQMRDGEPAFAPSVIADKVVGLYTAMAVLAALCHRERTGGGGAYVEVPMFETMTAFTLAEHLSEATFDSDGSFGYSRALFPTRKPYRTADGWMAALPYTAAHWTRVLAAIGRDDIVTAGWLNIPAERARRTSELYAILSETLLTRTTKDWLAEFERLDVPAAPVNLPKDLPADPHHAAVGTFSPRFSSESPVIASLRFPVTHSGVEATPDRPPPPLGSGAGELLSPVSTAQRND